MHTVLRAGRPDRALVVGKVPGSVQRALVCSVIWSLPQSREEKLLFSSSLFS